MSLVFVRECVEAFKEKNTHEKCSNVRYEGVNIIDAMEFALNLFHPLKWVLWAGATHLFHYRQNFYHWSLWVPIPGLWSLAVTLLIWEFTEAPWIFYVVIVNLLYVMLTHLWGAYLHYIGVSKRVGGQNLNNHMVGPPVILPLIVFVVSTIDLLRILGDK